MHTIVDENGFVLATCTLETARSLEDKGQVSAKRTATGTVYVAVT